MNLELTREEKRYRGNYIASILGLKRIRGEHGQDVYKLKENWGNKSDLSLYEVLERLILHGE